MLLQELLRWPFGCSPSHLDVFYLAWGAADAPGLPSSSLLGWPPLLLLCPLRKSPPDVLDGGPCTPPDPSTLKAPTVPKRGVCYFGV